MFEQAGGLIGNFIPFGIFLYLTLVAFGIIKPENKPKFLDKQPKYFKLVLLLGLICFTILIVMNIIDLK